ncbi:MAG: MBL fold metallo-hydrolase [Acidobacteria bacterium]|nr:MBL fold metallo-hydrolase [Acidobacteriota bacterium]
MFFRQFRVEGLGCYSYLIGCPGAGVACVVDPERFVDHYIDTAQSNEMRITHIFDTHLHADHLTGSVELAERTGGRIHVHPGVQAEYDHCPLAEGDRFRFGSAGIQVLETPGHTPNSVTLCLTDHSRSDEVMLLLTGDLLFVGDIGRPDLAGEDMLEEQVRNLYHSLYEKLGQFPDWTEVYPAHGEGSLCGKGMSAKSMSTLGFERRHNPLLNAMDFQRFREIMLADFQLRPPNFIAIVDKNRTPATRLTGLTEPRKLAAPQVEEAREHGAVLVDIRPATAFGAAFIPGALNIGLAPASANWLGTVVDAGRELVLIAHDEVDVRHAVKQFRRVGYDRIIGYIDRGVSTWAAAGKPLEHLPQLSVQSLKHVLEKYPDHLLLDVRTEEEWRTGHVTRARHKPVSRLLREGIDIRPERHITLVCSSGYRSNIAGSYLKAHGYRHVFSLIGGMTAWENFHRYTTEPSGVKGMDPTPPNK